MKLFVTYLLIGAIFTLIMDWLSNHWNTEDKFNNFERIIVILIWPVSLFIFLREFIREIKKK